MQQPMEGVPPNRVVRELKKGFKLKEQVIRPTQVIVSGPAPAGAGEGEEGAAERE
jgi:molecular chaperone GrpE (heat shock protein)